MGDGIGTAANKFQDGDLLGAFRDVARVVASAKPGTTVHKIKTSVVSGAMKGAMMVQVSNRRGRQAGSQPGQYKHTRVVRSALTILAAFAVARCRSPSPVP